MKALAPTPSLRPCTFSAPTLTGMSASPGPPAPPPVSAVVPETNGSSAEIPWWWSRLTPSGAADGYGECVVRSAGPRDKGPAPVGGKAPWTLPGGPITRWRHGTSGCTVVGHQVLYHAGLRRITVRLVPRTASARQTVWREMPKVRATADWDCPLRRSRRMAAV